MNAIFPGGFPARKELKLKGGLKMSRLFDDIMASLNELKERAETTIVDLPYYGGETDEGEDVGAEIVPQHKE